MDEEDNMLKLFSKYLNKITIILSSVTIAFVVMVAVSFLDSKSESIDYLSLISHGLTITAGILFIINAAKNKKDKTPYPVFFFLGGQALLYLNALLSRDSFSNLVPLLIIIATIVLYILSLNNQKFDFCVLIFLIILLSINLLPIYGQSKIAFGNFMFYLAIILNVIFAKTEEIE